MPALAVSPPGFCFLEWTVDSGQWIVDPPPPVSLSPSSVSFSFSISKTRRGTGRSSAGTAKRYADPLSVQLDHRQGGEVAIRSTACGCILWDCFLRTTTYGVLLPTAYKYFVRTQRHTALPFAPCFFSGGQRCRSRSSKQLILVLPCILLVFCRCYF